MGWGNTPACGLVAPNGALVQSALRPIASSALWRNLRTGARPYSSAETQRKTGDTGPANHCRPCRRRKTPDGLGGGGVPLYTFDMQQGPAICKSVHTVPCGTITSTFSRHVRYVRLQTGDVDRPFGRLAKAVHQEPEEPVTRTHMIVARLCVWPPLNALTPVGGGRMEYPHWTGSGVGGGGGSGSNLFCLWAAFQGLVRLRWGDRGRLENRLRGA